MKRNNRIALISILTLLSVSCIKKTNGAPVTPMEKIATYNAAFADLNNSIERGTEVVSSEGLLAKQQAAPVLLWCAQVATAHQQITAIIAQGTVSASDLTSVEALLDQIKSSGDALIASGILGIKNPNSQQTFAADFNSLYSLADTILSLLKAQRTRA